MPIYEFNRIEKTSVVSDTLELARKDDWFYANGREITESEYGRLLAQMRESLESPWFRAEDPPPKECVRRCIIECEGGALYVGFHSGESWIAFSPGTRGNIKVSNVVRWRYVPDEWFKTSKVNKTTVDRLAKDIAGSRVTQVVKNDDGSISVTFSNL